MRCGVQMVNLVVTWQNATRPAEDKARIESAYRQRLIELFGSIAAAAEAKGHWERNERPPIHHWQNYNRIAIQEANLTPSERRIAHFIVRFES